MVSRKNIKMLNEKNRDEKQRFSIRKLSIGAASVLVGLAFSAYSGQTVLADTTSDGSAAQVEAKKNEQENASDVKAETDKTADSQTQTAAVSADQKTQNAEAANTQAVKEDKVTKADSQNQNGGGK